MRFRPFEIKDHDQVYRIWEEANGVSPNQTDDGIEGIARYLERNPGTSFVAEQDGKIVGAILAGHDGRRGFIHHAAVLEEYQRKGVGRRLADLAMDALREKGIRKVALLVFRDNGDAAQFWQEMGFELRSDLDYRNRFI